MKKLVKFWKTPAELGSMVSRSVVKLIKNSPAVGWVRADLIFKENSMVPITKVRNRNFTNEKVLLDGFDYKQCKFTNVKFVYNGTAEFKFTDNIIEGMLNFSAGSLSVFCTVAFLKGLGLLKENISLRGENEELLNNIKPPTII